MQYTKTAILFPIEATDDKAGERIGVTEASSEQTKRQILQSAVLSRVTAGVVCALLIIFFLTTIGNTTTILSKVEMVKVDQYPASVAAGHLETRLVQLRTMAAQSVYMNSPDGADGMLSISQDSEAEIWGLIETIEGSTAVDPEDVRALRDGYADLNVHLATLAEMVRAPGTSPSQVGRYVNDEIYPVVSQLLDVDLEVLAQATDAVDNVYETVNAACRQTIFIAWILIIAVAISLFVYLAILNRKTRREEQLTANLEHALDLAQSASRAKSTFLSSMSHDIRTPMNAIVGLTAIASNNLDDRARVEHCLARITTSSKHLLSLVNDVLDMSEIESGRIALNEDIIELPTLMDDFAGIMQEQARKKGIDLETKVGPLAHPIVRGDALRLQQMMLNLASNAVKYTHNGGWVRITLTEEAGDAAAAPARVADSASATGSQDADEADADRSNAHEGNDADTGAVNIYRLVVEDNGIGMEQDFLENIFQPFERERNETTPFTEGAGLGMTITKNVVDLMDGTISVKSQPGRGSKFTVLLPLASAEAEKPNTTSVPADDAPLTGRVLLVEDDALNREIAIELIQSLGVDVETAEDGLDAVTAFTDAETGRYGMIFMDFQMPRMGGLEAAAEIIRVEQTEGRPHTPIVAMTANAFNEDRQKAMDAGMDGFMSKPINIAQLKRNLRRFLSGPATSGQERE